MNYDTARNAEARARCNRYGGRYVEDVLFKIVAARDGDKCHLCGEKVLEGKPRDHRVGNNYPPLGPVMDHVVPLAAGGEHSYANVRIAHYLCNSFKGQRGNLSASERTLMHARIRRLMAGSRKARMQAQMDAAVRFSAQRDT